MRALKATYIPACKKVRPGVRGSVRTRIRDGRNRLGQSSAANASAAAAPGKGEPLTDCSTALSADAIAVRRRSALVLGRLEKPRALISYARNRL